MNFERKRSSSMKSDRDPFKKSQTLRPYKSESTLKPHKGFYSHPSLETLIKLPSPSNAMYDSYPAGAKISPQDFLDVVDFEELRRQIKKFSTLCEKLYGRRLQLKEKRNELRQERNSQMASDAKFMRIIRENRQEPKQSFEEIYTQLELQRDVVGELQYDYDQAEDEHDVAENQLDKEGESLTKLLQKFLGKDQDDDESSLSTSWEGGPEPDRLPEANKYDEAQIRLMEYQSRIGDARIMQERLQELISERERRLSFARKRGNHQMNNNDLDKDFSEQFDATSNELDSINADVQRLKEALQNDGYLDFSPVEQIPMIPEVLDPHPLPPAAPKKNRPTSDSILPTLQKHFGVARARISWWILVTFSHSPVEHRRHKEILRELGYTVSDDRKWANRVFEFWKKDDECLSIGSWDEIEQQDLLEYDRTPRFSRMPSSILLSGRSKAEDAVDEYEQQFPFSSGAPKDRSTPFDTDILELDMLSEYESRSV